jgi:hypothetical protein
LLTWNKIKIEGRVYFGRPEVRREEGLPGKSFIIEHVPGEIVGNRESK